MTGSERPKAEDYPPRPMVGLDDALERTLQLVSHNIGFAGLGFDSDFFADGGKRRFAPSPKAARRNLSGIISQLKAVPADAMLLQEVSRTTPINWLTDVHGGLRRAFPDWQSFYRRDIFSRFIPWPARFDHGAALFCRFNPSRYQMVPLPQEGGRMHGFLTRHYGVQMVRVAMTGGGEWTIGNVHLAAFDSGGDVRKRQLRAVLDYVEAEYLAGRHVVVGGDWNLVIAEPGWPSTAERKDLFWLVDFPHDMLKPGWRITSDKDMPTVRTLNQPYVPGENYTTSIDGFLTSPNVSVDQVHAIDNGFAHSDHQPIVGAFSAR